MEKALEKSKDPSGKMEMNTFVLEFWELFNHRYYVIACDCFEGEPEEGNIVLHCGQNIQAGFYLPHLRESALSAEALESASPFPVSNTLVYVLQVHTTPVHYLVLAFRPQLEESLREILISTLRFMLAQQLRNESIHNEYEQARLVQTSLLPQDFAVTPAFDIHCQSRSCDIVSGDAYDVFAIDGETTAVLVADALGHGFPAALQARDVIIGIRMGIRKGIKLSFIMQDLNKIINQTKLTSRFVSVFLGELENNGNLFYVNAGHIPPIYIHGEVVARAEIRNVVVGPLEHVNYKMGFFHIDHGGTLAMFTDGIVEALDADGQEFGRERLIAVIRANIERGAREIVAAVFAAVDAHSDHVQYDDMTMMIIKRR